MPSTFQTTFQHLVAANNLIHNNGGNSSTEPDAPVANFPSTPAAPTPNPTIPPPPTPVTDIQIIQGRTPSSKNLLHAGFRYSKDGKPLTDGRQSWRCVKRNEKCPGRLYTVNDTFHCLGKGHVHATDASDCNVKAAISKAKEMASTSQTSNHRIYCAVAGSLPTAALSRLPTESAIKKAAQRARRANNPQPRNPTSLQELILESEDCKTLRGADMLFYDNGGHDRRVIILATSGNLKCLRENDSWYLDGTFKSAPLLFYQLLVIHAELRDRVGTSRCVPVIYILLTHKDTPIYTEAFEALVANCPHLNPQVTMADFEQAIRSALSSIFPAAVLDNCHFHYCQALLTNVNQLGYKAEYEAVTFTGGVVVHSELYIWIRRLMMLAFIPVDEVAAVFNYIVDHIPDSLNLDPFLGYYSNTWIAGLNGRNARFPPERWNQTSRVEANLGRTNNYCESFNKTFAAVVNSTEVKLAERLDINHVSIRKILKLFFFHLIS